MRILFLTVGLLSATACIGGAKDVADAIDLATGGCVDNDCTCPGDGQCELECTNPEETCDVLCGAGSECDVECPESVDCDVMCQNAETCDVNCEDSDSCDVVCDGADCDVDCSGVADCDVACGDTCTVRGCDLASGTCTVACGLAGPATQDGPNATCP